MQLSQNAISDILTFFYQTPSQRLRNLFVCFSNESYNPIPLVMQSLIKRPSLQLDFLKNMIFELSACKPFKTLHQAFPFPKSRSSRTSTKCGLQNILCLLQEAPTFLNTLGRLQITLLNLKNSQVIHKGSFHVKII